MSLVKNNNKSKQVIPRGTDIKPNNEFSMNDLQSRVEKKEHISPIEYVAAPTSIKVDTKIRDTVNALSLIGYGDNQKDVIENVLTYIIESMSTEHKRSFEHQYKVLENKTINRMKK